MLKGVFIMNQDAFTKIYGEPEFNRINNLVDIIAPPMTAHGIAENLSILNQVDVIFSGWGMVKLDEKLLQAAPRLQVVFYGSGSIKGFVTEKSWDRGIIISSAYAANAVPVAEYTLSQILFSLKHGWYYVNAIKQTGKYPEKTPVPGAYNSTVGIISLGMIGRMVVEHLKRFDLNIIAYDPYVTPENGAKLGVTMHSLESIFKKADVVSLHTPWLPETAGMITGAHFASMKNGSTFINTARGAVVKELEMIDVLHQRPDIFAILDVTYPEPPTPGSLLYSLPNVILTPHIAGSMFTECRRMGSYMVDELERFLARQPLQWSISREKAKVMA
ncbi:MAG: hydroxyacid dehydrogenase [Anaerolineae bacterium]|nr:hydroxyacid dehydrogenase [Anaerolineae bacterium]